MEGRPPCRPKNSGTGQSPSLQDRHLLVAVSAIGTNAALLCPGYEIEKLARGCANFHGGGFLERLRNIQPAGVKQFKSSFNLVSILHTESGTA